MKVLFFFKQKTAYEMRISDWSSDVCSSVLQARHLAHHVAYRDQRGGRESTRNAARQRGLGLRRDRDRRDHIVRGRVEGARREDEHIVETEIIPFDGAARGDPRLHLDAQNIDRQRVADGQAQRFRGLLLDPDPPRRSEGRRGGKEGVSTGRYRWTP